MWCCKSEKYPPSSSNSLETKQSVVKVLLVFPDGQSLDGAITLDSYPDELIQKLKLSGHPDALGCC